MLESHYKSCFLSHVQKITCSGIRKLWKTEKKTFLCKGLHYKKAHDIIISNLNFRWMTTHFMMQKNHINKIIQCFYFYFFGMGFMLQLSPINEQYSSCLSLIWNENFLRSISHHFDEKSPIFRYIHCYLLFC